MTFLVAQDKTFPHTTFLHDFLNDRRDILKPHSSGNVERQVFRMRFHSDAPRKCDGNRMLHKQSETSQMPTRISMRPSVPHDRQIASGEYLPQSGARTIGNPAGTLRVGQAVPDSWKSGCNGSAVWRTMPSPDVTSSGTV